MMDFFALIFHMLLYKNCILYL